jgi:glycerophosphoryl diester phosphodiesterase
MDFAHPYLDWPGPIPFAHRGGTSEHPENTLPAFRHAVDLGFRYLETDVHVSADGVLVAFHDEDLSRTCGVDARIDQLTWKELSELRVDGREPIPAMRELFEAFPDARFNIDAKSDDSVDPLCDLVTELHVLDRVCLAAFKWKRLRRIRRRFHDRVMTNTSQNETASLVAFGRLPGRLVRAVQVPVRHGCVSVTNERLIRHSHQGGCPVHVWTIDEPDEMHRLLDLGVDGIMTDRPGTLRDVFVERGIWHE